MTIRLIVLAYRQRSRTNRCRIKRLLIRWRFNEFALLITSVSVTSV